MRIISILFIVSTLLATACGGPAEQANNSGKPPANSNSTVISNANIPPEFSGATNAVPQGANSAVNGKAPVKGDMPAPKGFEIGGKEGPAPDDSDVKTALGENLVQTRTFRSHAQLDKVERTTAFVNGEPKSTVKVYLKNGQVKDASALKDPMAASAAEILKAAR